MKKTLALRVPQVLRRGGVEGFGLVVLAGLLSACTALAPPKPDLPPRASIVPGEQVKVEASQNVYAIARRYKVSMRDLIVLNDLQPPFLLRQGQKLTLPAGTRSEAQDAGTTAPEPAAAASLAVEQTTLPPIETAPLAPIKTAEGHPSPLERTAPQTPLAGPPPDVLASPPPAKPLPSTARHEHDQQLASFNPSEMKPSPAMPLMSFVWPVQGPIVSGFGPKGQGLSNDGMNIGAPKGTPVVAAASGIVVYAGNEMKGFGNLILIRHQGGWVTAYAHLDRTLVAKDAVVAQGDMIGTVGKTGNVPSPQLHFETRYQGKPVDPGGIISLKKD